MTSPRHAHTHSQTAAAAAEAVAEAAAAAELHHQHDYEEMARLQHQQLHQQAQQHKKDMSEAINRVVTQCTHDTRAVGITPSHSPPHNTPPHTTSSLDRDAAANTRASNGAKKIKSKGSGAKGKGGKRKSAAENGAGYLGCLFGAKAQHARRDDNSIVQKELSGAHPSPARAHAHAAHKHVVVSSAATGAGQAAIYLSNHQQNSNDMSPLHSFSRRNGVPLEGGVHEGRGGL
eukprot:CAMPEP_0179449160 /NCGR_PEP_ID=MMETSP0799-20121207/33139_1 /TAXON_ID=46947 /ORGANISM="Geminigera cryophila, Strain CCMP2564" /LENGTH=231 /DNA_ID=CAMNT_0021241991 /DNA_START=135 /DNA_END=830 /DNA_ORIENTATION=+